MRPNLKVQPDLQRKYSLTVSKWITSIRLSTTGSLISIRKSHTTPIYNRTHNLSAKGPSSGLAESFIVRLIVCRVRPCELDQSQTAVPPPPDPLNHGSIAGCHTAHSWSAREFPSFSHRKGIPVVPADLPVLEQVFFFCCWISCNLCWQEVHCLLVII